MGEMKVGEHGNRGMRKGGDGDGMGPQICKMGGIISGYLWHAQSGNSWPFS